MKTLLFIITITSVVAAQSQAPRKGIPEIARTANGAIVSIVMSDKDGKPIAQGSGFVISSDGVILTNYHVIAEGSSAVVRLPDGVIYPIDGVLAADKTRDVAVIKAHGKNFRTLTLGDSDQLQVGEEVVAIGNPLSLESTVSNGIVSGIRTAQEKGGNFLQITTPISPGSSGGPLFSMAGEVVGITTMHLESGENLNFAIPINDAKHLLLAESSKAQVLPNETGPVKSETPAGAAPPPSVSPTTARNYYKQLYDAGGFKSELNNFVCFNERPESSLEWFFTFSVRAYDERYAKAAKAHTEALLDKTKDESEAWQTMRSIEASNPNVYFQDDDSLSIIDAVFGAGTEAYLRGGGRVLIYTPYDKGVKIGDVYYRRAGADLWIDENDHSSNPLVKTDKTSLSFEPTTLRYVMRTVTTFTDGNTVVNDVVAGICEKIPAIQSN